MDTTTQLYITLLEKTNQQLSLWTNPYGILVGALAILFTVLTIVAVFIILRQGKEYKESFQKALEDYKNSLNLKINEIGSESQAKIQNVVESYQAELESIKKVSKNTTKESKEKMEKIELKIKELQKEKDSIGSRIQFSSVDNNQPFVLASQLNNPLRVGTIANINSLGLLNKSIYCPVCGSYNGGAGLLMATSNYCSNCGNKL